MPPKRSKAFNLAKASVLERTTTRSDGDSVDVSLEATPFVSVQRQLYPPTSVSPTTDVTLPDTEASTSTSDPLALDIRINCRRTRIHVEPTEEPVTKKARRGIITGKEIKRDIANNENKRLPLKWSMVKELPDTNKVTRIAKQIGSIVREHIPMLTKYYFGLEKDDFLIVVDQLSVFFRLILMDLRVKPYFIGSTILRAMHTKGGELIVTRCTSIKVVFLFRKTLYIGQISETFCARFLKKKHGRIHQRGCRKQDCLKIGSSINRDRFCSSLGLINLKLMDTWLLISVQLSRPLKAKTVKNLSRKPLRR